METILKYSIIVFLLTILGCKTTSTTTEKKHIVLDTHYVIETSEIQVPVKNVTIIESPCKDSILQPINQVLEIGETSIKISEREGDLIAEIESKGDTIKSTDTTKSHIEEKSEIQTITKYRVAKWCWYLLGIVIIYVTYRILRLSIPILRILPY